MPDLREQLGECFQGRTCLMGLGNTDYGDDGLGVRLAEKLAAAGVPDVIVAGTMPERFIDSATADAFDYLVFLDAVEFGAPPGSVVFLNAEEMAARFPQISTHKISLGLMAKLVEEKGRTRARLLGIQPESLKSSGELSNVVRDTLDLLSSLIIELSNRCNDTTTSSEFRESMPV
jgi:hydrogenase maturation protease